MLNGRRWVAATRAADVPGFRRTASTTRFESAQLTGTLLATGTPITDCGHAMDVPCNRHTPGKPVRAGGRLCPVPGVDPRITAGSAPGRRYLGTPCARTPAGPQSHCPAAS